MSCDGKRFLHKVYVIQSRAFENLRFWCSKCSQSAAACYLSLVIRSNRINTMHIKSLILALSCASGALAQLADTTAYPIGPLTSSSNKWATKVCDITDYGAVADGESDAGPARSGSGIEPGCFPLSDYADIPRRSE